MPLVYCLLQELTHTGKMNQGFRGEQRVESERAIDRSIAIDQVNDE